MPGAVVGGFSDYGAERSVAVCCPEVRDCARRRSDLAENLTARARLGGCRRKGLKSVFHPPDLICVSPSRGFPIGGRRARMSRYWSTLMSTEALQQACGAPPRSNLVRDYVVQRFVTLCRAARFEPSIRKRAIDTFESLVVPVSLTTIHEDWISDISDDHTPVEFSVAIAEGRCEVRVLFEPQGDRPTLASYREAALAFHAKLERDHGVDLSRFRRVEDLFVPETMTGGFAVWSSLVFRHDGAIQYKSYLNPQARGAAYAYALVEEGLSRLGFDAAWHAVARRVARRGPYLDELKYLALDLDRSRTARVKVYARHHSATIDEIEQACSASAEYVPGEVGAFVAAMTQGEQVLQSRAVFTCSAFTSRDPERPAASTFYLPVCAYADNDLEVRRRVSSFMAHDPASQAIYREVLDGYTTRGLESGVGLQSWAAVRRLCGQSRLTVYLSTESRRIYTPGSVPAATTDHYRFDSIRAVLATTRQYTLRAHPLVNELIRRDDPRPILRVLRELLRRLATTLNDALVRLVARLPDRELRAALVDELNAHVQSTACTCSDNVVLDRLAQLLVEDDSDLPPTSGEGRDRRVDSGLVARVEVYIDDIREACEADCPYEALSASLVISHAREQLVESMLDCLAGHPPQFGSSGALPGRFPAFHLAALDHVIAFFEEPSARLDRAGRSALCAHAALWRALDEIFEGWRPFVGCVALVPERDSDELDPISSRGEASCDRGSDSSTIVSPSDVGRASSSRSGKTSLLKSGRE